MGDDIAPDRGRGARALAYTKDIDRLFSIHHKRRLDQIETALAVLGRRLVVSVEPA
jgi:hypothetical protein